MAKPPSSVETVDKDRLRRQVVAKLREDVDALERVALAASEVIGVGAIVDGQESDGRRVRYFVLPAGQGVVVGKMVSAVMVVTPDSAIGAKLMGRRAGDVVEMSGKQGARTLTIVAVV